MGIKSQRKGSSGERDIHNRLSEWWPGEFARRAGKKGSDSVCPDNYPFSNEIKNFSSVRVHHFMFPHQAMIGWWQQAVKQAQDEQRHPLLIVKADRNWFVVLRPGAWLMFNSLPTHFIKTVFQNEPVYVLPLEKFLDYRSVWKQMLTDGRVVPHE